jgi:hypothetical protein
VRGYNKKGEKEKGCLLLRQLQQEWPTYTTIIIAKSHFITFLAMTIPSLLQNLFVGRKSCIKPQFKFIARETLITRATVVRKLKSGNILV